MFLFQWNIYSRYLVCATSSTGLNRPFGNLADIFYMDCGCACCLDVNLRLFLSLFSHSKLIHFRARIQNLTNGRGLSNVVITCVQSLCSRPQRLSRTCIRMMIRRLCIRSPPDPAASFRRDWSRSFSPFRWFKKDSCQFLAEECAQLLVNRLED